MHATCAVCDWWLKRVPWTKRAGQTRRCSTPALNIQGEKNKFFRYSLFVIFLFCCCCCCCCLFETPCHIGHWQEATINCMCDGHLPEGLGGSATPFLPSGNPFFYNPSVFFFFAVMLDGCETRERVMNDLIRS